MDTFLDMLKFSFTAWTFLICILIPPAALIFLIGLVGHLMGKW